MLIAFEVPRATARQWSDRGGIGVEDLIKLSRSIIAESLIIDEDDAHECLLSLPPDAVLRDLSYALRNTELSDSKAVRLLAWLAFMRYLRLRLDIEQSSC